jgi:hypothetical protein
MHKNRHLLAAAQVLVLVAASFGCQGQPDEAASLPAGPATSAGPGAAAPEGQEQRTVYWTVEEPGGALAIKQAQVSEAQVRALVEARLAARRQRELGIAPGRRDIEVKASAISVAWDWSVCSDLNYAFVSSDFNFAGSVFCARASSVGPGVAETPFVPRTYDASWEAGSALCTTSDYPACSYISTCNTHGAQTWDWLGIAGPWHNVSPPSSVRWLFLLKATPCG